MNTITVLMSTYNGEKYLEEQIESLLAQEKVHLQILVRDDGSTDRTREILDSYQNKKKLLWYTGKNLKSAKSFMNLISEAPDSEYYAFCDQDDVWNKEKLSKAIGILEKSGDKNIPCLYCSNYQLVDAKLNKLPDNKHVSTTTFEAALVSSCCTGCTVVFNKKLLEILQLGYPETIVMHDDWVHKVCLAVGGKVIYDDYKSLMYRQHGANVDGGIHGFRSRFYMICQRIKNKDCIRSNQLKELLRIYEKMMPTENLILTENVVSYCNAGIIKRIQLINNKKICTPYSRLNRGYRVAIIFKYF